MVGDTLTPSPGLLALGAAAGVALLATALVSARLAVITGTGACTAGASQPVPGPEAETIPAAYLQL